MPQATLARTIAFHYLFSEGTVLVAQLLRQMREEAKKICSFEATALSLSSHATPIHNHYTLPSTPSLLLLLVYYSRA